MSQQDVIDILKDFGGEATAEDIRSEAKKRFPNRTLNTYVSKRLQAMKRQGIVEETTIGGKSAWKLAVDDVRELREYATVGDVDSEITEDVLTERGISIRNLVGSFEIGRRLDLNALAVDIPDAEYHSETHSNMVYRSPDYESLTVLVPASGRVTVVGAKSKDELVEGARSFIEILESLGIEVKGRPNDLKIQNIVGTGEVGRELDLGALVVGLGLEDSEYNPEQFPGLIYRKPNLPVILLFGSGKIVITGGKTYSQVLEGYETITEKIENLFENE